MEKAKGSRRCGPSAAGWNSLICVLVLFFFAVPAGLALEFTDSPFVFLPGVRVWGADVTVGCLGPRLLGSVDTVLWAHVGGGWEDHKIYRDFAADGAAGTPLAADDERAGYRKLTLDWQLGLAQGLLWSTSLDHNLLEVILQSRWRLEDYRQGAAGESSLLASALADSGGLFMSTFLLALHLDGVQTSRRRRTSNGVDAEASVEWAPAGLFGTPMSFIRLNAHVEGLITLADAGNLALVAGDRLEGDIVFAGAGGLRTIPVWARTTFGGVNPYGFGGQEGLGGALRGVHNERFDGTLKIVNNLEVRLLFPEILPVSVFPGLIAFLDAGTSDFRALDRSPILPDDLFISMGMGLYLHALEVDLVVCCAYCAVPSEARGLKVDFQIGTHF